MKFAIIYLLFTYALSQTCFGLASTASNVCNSKGSCVAQDSCSCFSGYAGAQCELSASTTSCTWNVNTQTKTDFYPVIDTTTLDFQNNNLIFSIMAPIVTDRLNTTIFVQDVSYDTCKYPGANAVNVLDTSSPCYNRYNFQIPWSTGKNCGWTRTDLTDKIQYSGNIYILEIENIGFLRGTPIQRSITRVIPLTIEFQTQVTVSTTVKVFSPVNMLAAVTKQLYIAGPPSSGLFEFTTSLQYPFILDVAQPFSITKNPAGLTATLVDISDTAQCLPNQPCNQKFQIPLQIGSACSFTGDYEASFSLACHASITNPADCPLDPANKSAKVLITANSENYCTAAKVEINISGTLTSFSDNTYSVQKNAFLLDQTSFFKAQIFSPKATLKTSTIIRVQWQSQFQTSVLYDNSALTTDGTSQQFALGPATATTATFNFLLPAQYLTIPVDSSTDFNVTSTIQVTYESIEGTTSDIITHTYGFNSINDVKASKPKNAQDGKYADKIQVFGIKAVKSSTSIISFATFALFGLLIFYL